MSEKSASTKKDKRLPLIEVPALIKESVLDFFKEQGLFHGAALAYYTLFAMVPLFYLSISLFGRIIGQEVMLEIISDLLRNKIGVQDISGIMDFLKQLNFEKGNFLMEMVSIIALLVASSAVIVCLKQSINEFFDLEIKFSSKRKKIVKGILFRLLSMLLIGAMTVFIIILYFAQSILLSMNDSFFEGNELLNLILSGITKHGLAIFSNAVIFSFVFKYVHDGFVQWKIAIGGAVITAIMLYIGQLLIKYYLFNYFFGASAGIAGSLFIILAWIYYSSQIIFFGAKFTAVYARKVGRPIHFKE